MPLVYNYTYIVCETITNAFLMKTDCFCTNPLSLTQNGGPYYNPMQGRVFYVYLSENWASKAKQKLMQH